MIFNKKRQSESILNPLVHQLIRSKRKSISLMVNENAELIVKAPIKTSIDFINQLIEKKQIWIEKTIKAASLKKHVPKKIENGENFYSYGIQYPLEIIDNTDFAIKFENGKFLLSSDCVQFGKNYFELWYKKQAKFYLRKRSLELAKLFKFNVKQVKISSADRRWGSCSSSGNINLSWRLMMAPIEIIDYVICHELAHLIELNHSDRFWQLVQNMVPDYKERRKWLKENGFRLEL